MLKGTTKIWILIIVFLIIIILGASIFYSLYLKEKSRDIYILSDISQIRSGLEVYFLLNNHYPEVSEAVNLGDLYSSTEKLCSDGFKRADESCAKNILASLPEVYKQEGIIYTYKSLANGQNYQIQFSLSTDFVAAGLKKGANCATNSQITSAACQ